MNQELRNTRTPFEIGLWLGVGALAMFFVCVSFASYFSSPRDESYFRYQILAIGTGGVLLAIISVLGLILRWKSPVPMSVLTAAAFKAFIPTLSSSLEEQVWNDFGLVLVGLVVGAVLGMLIDGYSTWKSESSANEMQNY